MPHLQQYVLQNRIVFKNIVFEARKDNGLTIINGPSHNGSYQRYGLPYPHLVSVARNILSRRRILFSLQIPYGGEGVNTFFRTVSCSRISFKSCTRTSTVVLVVLVVLWVNQAMTRRKEIRP